MHIDKVVHKISLLHSTSNETPTDFSLVKEIVNKLDIDWANPNLKFLDPACGRGTFLLAIIDKLENCGHSRKHIINNMIYGYDISKVQTMIARKAISMVEGTTSNIVQQCSLESPFEMQFDVIVTNPPFLEVKEDGGRKSMSTNLWTKFIDRCANELLSPGGSLAMISPASWAGPTKNLSGGRRILQDIFASKNAVYINISEKLNSYFSTGSTFSYVILKNEPYANLTTIELDEDSSIQVNLKDYSSLPRIKDALAYTINKKYFDKVSGEVIRGQLQTPSIIQYSENESKEFRYPAYHTASCFKSDKKFWFTDKHHPNKADHKVIISLSGEYAPFADKGTIGYTDMCLAYIVKPDETLESAYSVINSKFFHFIVKNNKWSGFNNKELIRNFALPPLDKVYTDKQIFEFFGLTKEEQEFVISQT